MKTNRPNLYALPTLPGTDPQSRRVMQDLVDQLNYLTGEVERLKREIPDVGARKENPQPGIISIPSFDSNGFIRVNEDGVIVSYVNPSPMLLNVGLSGSYFTDVATYQTGANTNETDFSVKIVEANTFADDGDFMLFTSRSLYAANANTKRYRIYWDSSPFFDTGTVAFNGSAQFLIGMIYRENSTTLKTAFANLVGTAINPAVSITAVTSTSFTVNRTLKITAQNGTASAGDITQAGVFILKAGARP